MLVAVGDVNGDGFNDVISGTGAGGLPRVRIVIGVNGSVLVEISPDEDTFKGGVQVAAADFDLDGDYEIVTATGKGAARVRVFSANGDPFTSASLPNFVNDFSAYGPEIKGGVFVAAGDVTGDGRPDLVTGVGKGGRPEVAVFSGTNGAALLRFSAFEPNVKSGVRVALADVDGDGRLDVLATRGSGKGTEVRAFDGVTGEEKTRFRAFDAKYKKGVFVAGVRR